MKFRRRLDKRQDWPLIERVRVVNLGPTDRVVLETSQPVTPEEMHAMACAWTAAFPELRKPIVLSGPLTLAAVLRSEPQGRLMT